jgi:hypothetical protein
LALRGKKEKQAPSGDEPEKTGRPMTFMLGLAVLFIGLFISLGSVFYRHHNSNVLKGNNKNNMNIILHIVLILYSSNYNIELLY